MRAQRLIAGGTASLEVAGVGATMTRAYAARAGVGDAPKAMACVAAAAAAFVLGWSSAPASAQGPLEWANKIFGVPASASSDSRPGRGVVEKPAPDDLRSGDVPLRSEETLKALDIAYGRYKAIAERGGWPSIPTARMMRPGDDDDRVPIVRRRLVATGELKSSNPWPSFNFDSELEAAVRRFQKRHGLSVNGRVDRSTIAAMNVPVQARLAQIKLNYDRLSALIDAHNRDERYVLVNAAGYQLEAVEKGRVAQRHRVIAGRPGRETPIVKAYVRALNFFPYWRVPDSIAKLDLAPKLIKEPDYLDKEQIRVLNGNYNGPVVDATQINWSRFDPNGLKFRQEPGPQNALGLVRLDMPNEHGVYMHDTPLKPLFGRPQRAFSAGCVRVQDVFDLAAWLGGADQGFDRARIDQILAAGQPIDVTLKHPVPVYFTYITAWSDGNGEVAFRADVYGRDGVKELSSDREHDPDAPPPPSPGLAP